MLRKREVRVDVNQVLSLSILMYSEGVIEQEILIHDGGVS